MVELHFIREADNALFTLSTQSKSNKRRIKHLQNCHNCKEVGSSLLVFVMQNFIIFKILTLSLLEKFAKFTLSINCFSSIELTACACKNLNAFCDLYAICAVTKAILSFSLSKSFLLKSFHAALITS